MTNQINSFTKATFVFLTFNFGLWTLNSYSQDTPPPRTNSLGGHFGVVNLLVINSGGTTKTIADEYNVGFPTGITIKTSNKFAFDVEMVPFISPSTDVHFLFHPGGLFPLGKNFTFGTRAAFEIGKGLWGFTPLINKAFPMKNGTAFFVEFVLPVRFDDSMNTTTIAGLHLGIGF